ncbi:hypothetical protein LAZ67_5003368 [Cordylochernes scorpioides]|uniref:Integrase catalytic domain-containing protein n=1 Tax=Cordylochernes scorpioides TaxID=51811 RepID=A0ABY6KI99_9ARAC|nr:hypothetical protein LAZ67_5003368 [Cordylochernes scorpioides]
MSRMEGIKPPAEFVPYINEKIWETWRESFEIFAIAVNLESMPLVRQRAILKHIAGEKTVMIYKTFHISENDTYPSLKEMLDMLTNHFKPFKNTIQRRNAFFTCVQKERQGIMEFVTELKQLAQECEFENSTESLIRDRLIIGILDRELKRKLLEDPQLTLPRAISMAMISESTCSQLASLNEKTTIQKFEKPYGKKCNACGKTNHFAVVCRTKRIRNLLAESESEESCEDINLNEVVVKTVGLDKWSAVIIINGKKTTKSKIRQPLKPFPVPDYPWQTVSLDIFYIQKKPHLLVVDRYSGYPEVFALNPPTAINVKNKLRETFARFGIPETMMSDNGPPFRSEIMTDFCIKWGIKQLFSSPHLHRSNGLAERSIQTIKNQLIKCRDEGSDPYLAILAYRNTPKNDMPSPAQLCLSRSLRCQIPRITPLYRPYQTNWRSIENAKRKRQISMKEHYDRNSKSYPKVNIGEDAWCQMHPKETWTPVKISAQANSPQSFEVVTPSGNKLIKNQQFIRPKDGVNEKRQLSLEPIPGSPEVQHLHYDSPTMGESSTTPIQRSSEETNINQKENATASAGISPEPSGRPRFQDGRTLANPGNTGVIISLTKANSDIVAFLNIARTFVIKVRSEQEATKVDGVYFIRDLKLLIFSNSLVVSKTTIAENSGNQGRHSPVRRYNYYNRKDTEKISMAPVILVRRYNYYNRKDTEKISMAPVILVRRYNYYNRKDTEKISMAPVIPVRRYNYYNRKDTENISMAPVILVRRYNYYNLNDTDKISMVPFGDTTTTIGNDTEKISMAPVIPVQRYNYYNLSDTEKISMAPVIPVRRYNYYNRNDTEKISMAPVIPVHRKDTEKISMAPVIPVRWYNYYNRNDTEKISMAPVIPVQRKDTEKISMAPVIPVRWYNYYNRNDTEKISMAPVIPVHRKDTEKISMVPVIPVRRYNSYNRNDTEKISMVPVIPVRRYNYYNRNDTEKISMAPVIPVHRKDTEKISMAPVIPVWRYNYYNRKDTEKISMVPVIPVRRYNYYNRTDTEKISMAPVIPVHRKDTEKISMAPVIPVWRYNYYNKKDTEKISMAPVIPVRWYNYYNRKDTEKISMAPVIPVQR